MSDRPVYLVTILGDEPAQPLVSFSCPVTLHITISKPPQGHHIGKIFSNILATLLPDGKCSTVPMKMGDRPVAAKIPTTSCLVCQ
jgi:hypothetical protein